MDIDKDELQTMSKSELINAYRQIRLSRDRVFTITSHDLRSPFSGLLGLSEMLVAGIDGLSPADLKDYLSTMRDSLKNTYKLLENLFEWGQIERQKYDKTIETIPCRIVTDEVLEELAELISAKEISIINNIDPEELVRTNSRMLEFILKNLISNAVKYSYRGGEVSITCEYCGDSAAVKVADSGIGISGDNLKKLFSYETTWKAHGTEGESGTGLGLLASGRFAEYFNAELAVESIPGEGSTFSLILPGPRA